MENHKSKYDHNKITGYDKAFLIFIGMALTFALACVFFTAGNPDVLDSIMKMVAKQNP